MPLRRIEGSSSPRTEMQNAGAMDAASSLVDLPDELILSDILSQLQHEDLCRAGCLSRRFRQLAGCNTLWKAVFSERWGETTPTTEAAVKVAGTSWKRLVEAKHKVDATSGGWNRPCEFELKAFLGQLADDALTSLHAKAAPPSPPSPATPPDCAMALPPGSPRSPFAATRALSSVSSLASSVSNSLAHSLSTSPSTSAPVFATTPPARAALQQQQVTPDEVQLIYLLDGSGSVSEEDFQEMKMFVTHSAPLLCHTLGVPATGLNSGKVAVIQFSTEPRVEIPLTHLDDTAVPSLATQLDNIVRVNGGTNIATAIAKAGAIMKAADQQAAAAAAAAATAAATAAGDAAAPMEEDTAPAAPGPAGPAAAGPAMVLPTHALPESPDASSEDHDDSLAGSEDLGSGAMSWERTPPPAPPALEGVGVGVGGEGVRRRVVVRLVLLLTDGRVDTYQAREARATALRLSDELSGTALAAFGVGRGVDRTELLHIVGAPKKGEHSRYLDLYTRDDGVPW